MNDDEQQQTTPQPDQSALPARLIFSWYTEDDYGYRPPPEQDDWHAGPGHTATCKCHYCR